METNINFLNRRELITVNSARDMMSLREALNAAGIACLVRPMGLFAMLRFDYKNEKPTCSPDKGYQYVIFVLTAQYDRAMEILKDSIWVR